MKEHFDREILENTHLVLNLPGKMRADKRLRNNFRVQVLVTELSNLSKAVGYAYCSNNYLAKKMGVSIDTIKRDLKLLSDCGYIQRETTFGSFKKERKIYVGDLFSNNFYEGARMPLAKVQGCPNKESLSYSIDKDKERICPNSSSSDASPSFSSSVINLCEKLRSDIQNLGIKVKDPKKSKKTWEGWLQDMDRLIRIDEISEREVSQMLDWVHTHDYWFAHIRCPEKLREKFETLLFQKKQQEERKTAEQKKIAEQESKANRIKEVAQKNKQLAAEVSKKLSEKLLEKNIPVRISYFDDRVDIKDSTNPHRESYLTLSYFEENFPQLFNNQLKKYGL